MTRTLTVLSLTVLMISAAPAAPHAQPKDRLDSRYQLTIHLDHGRVAAGQPILIHVDLKNLTQRRLWVSDWASDLARFRLAVLNAAGVRMPLTRYGRLYFTPPSQVYSNPSYSLAGGETRHYQMNIARLSDMTVADEYRVVLERETSSDITASGLMVHEKVISNTLHVTVTDDQPDNTRQFVPGVN